LIPFVKPFKKSVDIDTKTILVAGGKDILEAS
jgi:ribosomal 30S subunit maturation factor RimM